MLTYRFILIFGAPGRISLHTLIFINTLFFSHVASLQHPFTQRVLNAPFIATE